MIQLASRHTSRLRVRALTLLTAVFGGSIAPRPSFATQSENPVTLNLWLFEGEERLLPVLKEAYEAEHPNVTIEITLIPEDQYVVKIDTALAAGNPPDIGYLLEDRWVKAGKIAPLNDTIADHDIDVVQFNQAVMQGSCIVDGQYYCLGSFTGAVVLLYNRDMFDAAGLDYPSATEPLTVDEYAALAEQLSVPNDDIAQRVWGASAEAPYWWMARETMFSDDGRETTGFVNDEATKHAYQVLGDMVANGYAPSGSIMQSLGTEGAEALFLQEKLAMAIADFSNLSALEEGGINYGVAILPVEQDGDPAFLPVWTDEMTVFSDSDHIAEAKEFVAFVGTEGQRLRIDATGEPPLSAAAAEEFGWADQGNTQARAEFLQATEASAAPMFVPGFWDVTAPLGDAFNRIAEGDSSASDLLDDAAPRMQDSLDQNWETWEQLG